MKTLEAPVHPAVRWIVGNSPGSHANHIYSPGSDKLTEVHLYMSTSCKAGSRVIRAFADIEKHFFFCLSVKATFFFLKVSVNVYFMMYSYFLKSAFLNALRSL